MPKFSKRCPKGLAEILVETMCQKGSPVRQSNN